MIVRVLGPEAPVRHLAHADLTDRVRHAGPLRDQHINLPQLGDDTGCHAALRFESLCAAWCADDPFTRHYGKDGPVLVRKAPTRTSNADTQTGSYRAFHVGGGKWKVKRMPFKKPSGNEQPEHVYPATFDSESEAKVHIQRALVGTR